MGALSAILYHAEFQTFMTSAADRERFGLTLMTQVVDEVTVAG